MKRFLMIDPKHSWKSQSNRPLQTDSSVARECDTGSEALELLRARATGVILAQPITELDVEFWRDLYALTPVPSVLIVPDGESDPLAAGVESLHEGRIYVSTPRQTSEDQRYALPPQGIRFHELERTLLSQALTQCSGNQTRAGMLLGLSRDQIRYRMVKFGIKGRPEVDSGSQAA